MTEVEFHTGLADPLGFACRLLRKAFRKGARATVIAPPATIGALDRELWTFDERDFIPHVRWSAAQPARVLDRSPVWLVEEGRLPAGAPALVVNLGARVLSPDAPVQRLIELVGNDPDEQAAARERWRGYKARGLNVVHHAAGARREH